MESFSPYTTGGERGKGKSLGISLTLGGIKEGRRTRTQAAEGQEKT